jgi:hypothetical protein
VSRRDLQPVAVDRLEEFDHETRIQALRLVRTALSGPPHWHRIELDELLASDRLRDVLDCLSSMAAAGFVEYYGGWDAESAEGTLVREIGIAEDLAAGPPWTREHGDG